MVHPDELIHLYTITMSILLNFRADPKFVQLIGYRFCRKGTPGCLNDIFDGKLYTERSEFFSYPYNLSLTLNYDGAPKFKSSTMQIWPVQMIINELPPHLRCSLSYIKITFVCPSVCRSVCPSFTEGQRKQFDPVTQAAVSLATNNAELRSR